MLLKIEILLIPLLANSHIFEISEDDHAHGWSPTPAIIDEL
jgi:hypothetical protein